jgi:hypothetical protein
VEVINRTYGKKLTGFSDCVYIVYIPHVVNLLCSITFMGEVA